VNIKHNSQHTAECHQLLDISKNVFLDQLVLEPTRITETQSNTLDLFFTNNNTLVNQVRVIPGISDHEAVFIESSLRPIKKLAITREVWQYRKEDYDNLKKELNDYYND
jgi:L-lysine 2,3-aminomutase